MTDELESLLDEEELWEDEAVLPAGPLFGGRPHRRGAETLPGGPEGAEAPEEPLKGVGRGGWGETIPAGPLPEMVGGETATPVSPGEQSPVELTQRGRKIPQEGVALSHRGERGAGEALYHRLARTRKAAAYRREPGRGWQSLNRPVGGDLGTAPVAVEKLDRLVQRDARRYDGGFTWL